MLFNWVVRNHREFLYYPCWLTGWSDDSVAVNVAVGPQNPLLPVLDHRLYMMTSWMRGSVLVILRSIQDAQPKCPGVVGWKWWHTGCFLKPRNNFRGYSNFSERFSAMKNVGPSFWGYKKVNKITQHLLCVFLANFANIFVPGQCSALQNISLTHNA